jgi:ABC-type uncharacterized transport system permease subunit
MTGSSLQGLLSGSIIAGTPLLYATLGEVVGERAGIVNLGLEGVMLMGAVVGFSTTVKTGDPALGVFAAALAGALFNMIFGFVVIERRANQLASGLALMFCGAGLSALVGASSIGSQIKGLDEILSERSQTFLWLAQSFSIMIYWFISSSRSPFWYGGLSTARDGD